MPKNKPNWLTQGEAAALLGKSAKWVRDRSDLFASARNASGRYEAAALVAAFAEYVGREAVKQARREARGSGECPELTRWRRARADAAELAYAVQVREFVPMEPLRQFHNKEAALFRRGIERLELRYGIECAQVMLDILDDCDRLAREFFSDPQPTNEGTDNDDDATE